jgi:2'-5' RNA ligase
MTKRRLFIAINLPGDIRDKFIDYQRKWADLPVRWTPKSNLHITLVFIGYVGDDEMYEIINIAKETAKRHHSFDINLERIILGPPHKPPRMVWVEGEKNEEIAALKNDLEESLLESNNSGYRRQEARAYRPHITLGRIQHDEWRRLDFPPKIDEKFNFNFPVESIEVMQSDLKRDGAEYTILESIELGNL